jgi:DNA helicase-2/ATP-dependent DNA helicase PcrA
MNRSFLDQLNPPQRQAATTVQGPLMVLAGAGSGKTKMLTSRIAHLMLHHRVPGYSILAVTFTNKAAREMQERVSRSLAQEFSEQEPGFLPFASHQPEIGTFHSVCVRILRREMAFLPFTKPFVIYDDSDQLSLLKSVVQKLGLDEKTFSPKAFQAKINRLKCDAVAPEDFDPKHYDIFEKNLKRVYEQYQKDLFQNNGLDFGEIITLTYRVLRDSPEVRSRYQKRFQYIHVDEYQDTNRAQYLLLSLLASPSLGGHGNICVVGDEDQSIYKWRGADIRNILEFEHDYPNAQVVKLEQNYRSTKNIIRAASFVIRNNTQRKDKTLWTDNEQGASIQRAQLADERAEAEWIVSEMKRMATQDQRTFDHFAILYRTHAQSRQFEDVLRREKIPYQIVGGLRFYDRKEIKDVLAYFRLIANSSDSVSLKRVINVPARGIGATTLEKIEDAWIEKQKLGETLSLFEVVVQASRGELGLSGAVVKKLLSFVQLVENLIEKQPTTLLTEIYHLLLDETRYVALLRDEGTDEAQARIENLEELDTLLAEFEEEHQNTDRKDLLNLFLEQMMLASEVETGEVEQHAIQMMTLHSSKGLEFPVVFLPGMEEGLFPSVRAWEDSSEDEIEEERRLCYVGMTRAREHLRMTHVGVRRIWGQIHYQEPARFFQEMPDEGIEFHDFSLGAPLRAQSHFSGARRTDWSSEVSQEPTSVDYRGMRIQHPTYGGGKVVGVDGVGDDAKVTIEFAGGSRKKFLMSFVQSWSGGSSDGY